jgi:hypothetical protein
MFGFKKKPPLSDISDEILQRVYGILAFPRSNNDGVVPDSVIDSEYVIGFHCGLIMILYIELTGDIEFKHSQDWGVVLRNSLSSVFGLNDDELMQRIFPVLNNPSSEYHRGINDANDTYEMIQNNNNEAFFEFNRNIKHLYL